MLPVILKLTTNKHDWQGFKKKYVKLCVVCNLLKGRPDVQFYENCFNESRKTGMFKMWKGIHHKGRFKEAHAATHRAI